MLENRSFIIYSITIIVFVLLSTFIFSFSYADLPNQQDNYLQNTNIYLSANNLSEIEKDSLFLSNNKLSLEVKEKDLYYSYKKEYQILNNNMINIPQYPIERGIYTVNEGMPKNTRHLQEGYWIGTMPNLENIDSMYNHGIRLIITLAKTKPSWYKVRNKIESLDIEHIYVPIGSRFPKVDLLNQIISQYNPNEIFIHCEHGSDRSGTFISYLLIHNFHWTPQRALLAMLNPSNKDLLGLKKILNQYGYSITEEDLKYRGIYAGNSGLKVRNEDYERLVSTMLSTIKDYL